MSRSQTTAPRTPDASFDSGQPIGRPIFVGFAAVALILAVLMAMTMRGLHEASDTLASMSANHHKMFKTLYEMQYAARERILSLQAALYAEDEEEREEYIQAFEDMGEYFQEARRTLLELDFTREERRLLDAQGVYFEQLAPLEKEFISLMQQGNSAEAVHLLHYSIVPNQTEMIFVLGNLFEKKLERLDARVRDIRAEIERNDYIVWTAGSSGLLLVFVIGATVIRRSSQMYEAQQHSASKLADSLQDLEVQKKAVDLHNIVSVTDADGIITYVNDRFCEVSQYSREELLGNNHRMLKSGVHDDAFYQELWNTIRQGKVWQGEMCNRRKDGTLYWVTTTILPFVDEQDVPYKYVAVITEITRIKEAEQVLKRDRDELEAIINERTRELSEANRRLEQEIEERKALENELKKIATTDPLTGILNRRRFTEIFQAEINRSRRYRSPTSVIIFDIDHFKSINDTHGHGVGDEVLREVTRRVGAATRDVDVFARWGGEEFIILTPSCDLRCAMEFAERLRALISATEFPHAGHITCSFGVAQYQEGDDMIKIIEKADRKLYEAKNKGRNRVCG